MLAAALAIGSSLAWGLADFIAGLKSRRLPVLWVLGLSQVTALGLVGAALALRGEGAPPAGDFVVLAALSAVAGTIALSAFYRGLAVGAMSVVAPISATAAIIPVVVGVATGDRPTALQAVGVGLALVGVALAAYEPAGGGDRRVAAGAGLALVAAAGIGCFFLTMDAASDADVLWAILVNRITGVVLLGTAALALRPPLRMERGDLPALGAIGVLDMTANTLFAVAATEGLVSLVAVLGSLYPVVTIFLARQVLGERVRRLQLTGAAAAMAGVVLITAG